MNPASGRSSARGFSVTELLVAIAIIAVLIALLAVAVERAMRGGQRAQTEFLMGSIEQAFASFKTDHGYLPPVLGRSATAGSQAAGQIGFGRDLLLPPPSLAAFQQWASVTSIPEYLLGYGDRSADGYGGIGISFPDPNAPGAKELPTLGIRSPGRDGAWNSLLNPRTTQGLSPGVYAARNPGNAGAAPNASGNAVVIAGRVFGPYLDLKDARVLGAVTGVDAAGNPVVRLPGEIENFENYPKAILDYWGSPIRYYRRPYLGTDPAAPNAAVTLGDLFVLRPWEVKPGFEADGAPDGNGDTTTSRELVGAEFALLSAGPDRAIDASRRRDANGRNEDNIVRVGR